MLKKEKDLGDINFHNIFYLTQYIKLISFQFEFNIKMK